MKRASVLLLPLLVLPGPSLARAQSPATEIQSLLVEIWPDYDRPSVLILFTGTLGAAAPLPAVVMLPLPADATVNAVARIDESGRMIDDIAYHTGGGQLVLTTPDPRFRVEYYLPYRIEGDERTFEFIWLAEVAVDRLSVRVQRPAAAGRLVTVPRATDVAQAPDGLVYHLLPAQAVPAGSSFPIRVSYAMRDARLTAASRGGASGAQTPREAPASASPDTGLGWPNFLIGAVALAVVGIFVWQISRSNSAAGPKRAARGEAPEAARFCTACGKPIAAEDRFCRHCGAASEQPAASSSDR
jgi:hypothetical protein